MKSRNKMIIAIALLSLLTLIDSMAAYLTWMYGYGSGPSASFSQLIHQIFSGPLNIIHNYMGNLSCLNGVH